MLSADENRDLCSVTGTSPMARMMRRYWVPACLSDDVKERDCDPVSVRLFGENLVAFRDSDGRLGLIDEHCPHRLASLTLARNEECGLRCIYHGWKFNVAGECVDMPTEPPQYEFRERVRIQAYPVREAGGLVWTYMGPSENMPPFPEYDWMEKAADQCIAFKVTERCNYLQGMEGSVDSAHSWFLHRGTVSDWKQRSSISDDQAPKLVAEDTPYGFRYAAVRNITNGSGAGKYVRTTCCVLPFTIFIPRALDAAIPGHVQFFVPIDDTHTMFFGIFFSQDGLPINREGLADNVGLLAGRDVDASSNRTAHRDNRWNQDRASMKNATYTGITGVLNQDMAVQESMGPVSDRTREHLGTSDIGVIRLRRRLLDALRNFEQGSPPIGLDGTFDFSAIRGGQEVLEEPALT